MHFFKYRWHFSYTLFTLYPFVTKRGSIFLFLNRECISKPVNCFWSQNGQRGSLLVFYVGYILDDKNTLCNGCILNKMIGFYSECSCNMDSVRF
jgi:hypothetical protein